MTRRDALRQGSPDDVDDTFPSVTPQRRNWFRAHRVREGDSDFGCWYFASLPAQSGAPGGRFDLSAPRGTCYWASSELAAARELLGRPGRVIAHDEVEGVTVSHAEHDPGRLADLLHRDAAGRGVTQELASAVPYGLSQRWAAAFDTAGFEGIRYQPRFTTERAQAVACFGPAGRSSPARPVLSSRPVADVLRAHGITVLEPPSSRELSLLPD